MQGEGAQGGNSKSGQGLMSGEGVRAGGAAHRPHRSAAAAFARVAPVGAGGDGTAAAPWPRRESMSACGVPDRRVSSAAMEKREATSTAAGKTPIFLGGPALASDPVRGVETAQAAQPVAPASAPVSHNVMCYCKAI